jgi:hypothetical protein
MSESLVPPILNPASLYKEEARRDATRIRIYNRVLQQIYNRIKSIARIPGNEKSLLYVVPEFIPGTPRFDIGDAILYIVWNLRNVGYTVSYTHPNLLFISWRGHDERYRVYESPWSQVLQTAKTQAASGAAPTTISTVLKPQAATAPSAEIIKRKTILKKTEEYKPVGADPAPRSTNPTIVSALYTAAPAAPVPPPRLPGQLSDKHVSFV